MDEGVIEIKRTAPLSASWTNVCKSDAIKAGWHWSLFTFWKTSGPAAALLSSTAPENHSQGSGLVSPPVLCHLVPPQAMRNKLFFSKMISTLTIFWNPFPHPYSDWKIRGHHCCVPALSGLPWLSGIRTCTGLSSWIIWFLHLFI